MAQHDLQSELLQAFPDWHRKSPPRLVDLSRSKSQRFVVCYMSQVGLPLLARELTELAMRRRTYVVRVIYAASLLFICWLAFQLMVMGRSGRALDYLGTGSVILWWVGYLQNFGMLLVLPALACDVFTREKERQTIGLLFLTRLSPWTIVSEKFLSRLFPAMCLLLISLPLLALSYSLGGVEVWQIVNSAMGLITNAVVITAAAVACSSMCQTTTAAFLWTYFLISVTPLMVISSQSGGVPFDLIVFGRYLGRAVFPDYPNSPSLAQLSRLVGGGAISSQMLFLRTLATCIPSLVFASIYLVLARVLLVSRAFKKASRWRWGLAFIKLERTANEAFSKAFTLRRRPASDAQRTGEMPIRETSHVIDDREVPDVAPVAWRESRQRWLSRHPVRNGIAFSVLLILAGFWILDLQNVPPSRPIPVTMFSLVLWVGMLMHLITCASRLITQERIQQTLFVLLTTPMSGTEIVRQKLVGIRSLVWMWSIPLGTCLVLRMLVDMPKVQRRGSGDVDYPMALLNEATMLAIYPQVAIWGALYFSLRSRTTIAAIMKSILSIAFLCVLPWLILLLIVLLCGGLSEQYFGPTVALLVIGPADLLLYGYEFDCIPPGVDQSLFPVALNSMIHGGLWWWLRRQCLNKADYLLGRGERRSDEPVLA